MNRRDSAEKSKGFRYDVNGLGWNPHELEFGMCAGGHGGWVTDDE